MNMSKKITEGHPPHEPHIVQTGKESIKVCVPGEYVLSADPVLCNQNRKTLKLTVKNTGDRPIQVGSHTHFFEVNKKLEFPREKAFGYRLNIPAGTAIRFEPGDTKEVEICELKGKKVVFGFNSLTMGSTKSSVVKAAALEKAKKLGFKGA
jgi:urease subunit beta